MEILQNAAPKLHPVDKNRVGIRFRPMASNVRELITVAEIFEHIRDIRDPEHPHSLEVLGVVKKEDIIVDDAASKVAVQFTPTIPHCSMATLIGLTIKVKLLRSLPRRFKIRVTIAPGMHESELDINKQLADKERVAAAMENPNLARAVNQCIAP
ncbi:hypothetical protein Aperf_G00000125228 [Anoplocephala perfoliata]